MKRLPFAATIAVLSLGLGGPAAALPLPPGIPASDARAQAGFLDVTLYAGVDPSGATDSTAGLQKALDDGYEYGLAVWLPAGVRELKMTAGMG